MGFLQRKITVAEASKTTRQKGLCALVRVYTCFYNNSVGRSIYIYNIGGVPEKSGRVIKGGWVSIRNWSSSCSGVAGLVLSCRRGLGWRSEDGRGHQTSLSWLPGEKRGRRGGDKQQRKSERCNTLKESGKREYYHRKGGLEGRGFYPICEIL